jgi:hypothetical protein
MKGTIRLVLGFILMMGGVGGIETNTTEVLPLDSLSWVVVGLGLMVWAMLSIAKENIDNQFN